MEAAPYEPTSPEEPASGWDRVRSHVQFWVSGRQRSRLGVAIIAALTATSVVALPLFYRAARSDAPGVAAPEALLVRAADGGTEEILAGDTISDEVFIRWTGNRAEAVAFNLAEADGAILIESIDGEGPTFDFMVDEEGEPVPFDTRDYPDGNYDLLLSITTKDGREERSAARFVVENG